MNDYVKVDFSLISPDVKKGIIKMLRETKREDIVKKWNKRKAKRNLKEILSGK